MPNIRFAGGLFFSALVFGCMTTPRLGFPVKSIETPAPVTLFSAISAKGVLKKKMDLFGRESWRLMYDKRYLDFLSQINVGWLRKRVDEHFLTKVMKMRDLFKIEKKEVFNGGLEYSKQQDDPENYSGYDFSRYRNEIQTKYVLALTVDDWGYIATQDPLTTGPYMVFTMQLIDKDNSLSVWSFTKEYWKPIEIPLGYTDPGAVTLADIEDPLQKIIPKAVGDFFLWLSQE